MVFGSVGLGGARGQCGLGDRVEHRRLHLARDRAPPDQRVELVLVGLDPAGELLRRALREQGADFLQRFRAGQERAVVDAVRQSWSSYQVVTSASIHSMPWPSRCEVRERARRVQRTSWPTPSYRGLR